MMFIGQDASRKLINIPIGSSGYKMGAFNWCPFFEARFATMKGRNEGKEDEVVGIH